MKKYLLIARKACYITKKPELFFYLIKKDGITTYIEGDCTIRSKYSKKAFGTELCK